MGGGGGQEDPDSHPVKFKFLKITLKNLQKNKMPQTPPGKLIA